MREFQRLQGQRPACSKISVIPSNGEHDIGMVNSYAEALVSPLGWGGAIGM